MPQQLIRAGIRSRPPFRDSATAAVPRRSPSQRSTERWWPRRTSHAEATASMTMLRDRVAGPGPVLCAVPGADRGGWHGQRGSNRLDAGPGLNPLCVGRGDSGSQFPLHGARLGGPWDGGDTPASDAPGPIRRRPTPPRLRTSRTERLGVLRHARRSEACLDLGWQDSWAGINGPRSSQRRRRPSRIVSDYDRRLVGNRHLPGRYPTRQSVVWGGYSSLEKRSHADWRVIPSASPICAQVAPRDRALVTHAARLWSTWMLAAATGPRLPRTSSRVTSCSQGATWGTDAGLPAMTCEHSATHWSQMKTPGPATRVPTSVLAFKQNEHLAITAWL